jgi:uncharacterized repeat protein (TIGR01451 family)
MAASLLTRRLRFGALALTISLGGALLAPAAAHAAAPSADVSVAVSHEPATPQTGDHITFTVTASNAGPDPAADVEVGVVIDYPLDLVDMDGGCTESYGNHVSVVCDVGTIGPEGSAEARVTVLARSSGVYIVPAVASSTTPDPDAADLTMTDTFIVRHGPSQGERWVAGEFPTILGRPADAGAITYWGKRFKVAATTYPQHTADIPFAIMQSDEYRRLRIRDAYHRILDRAPSANDLAYWMPKVAAGFSYEAIERHLLTSGEFLRTHGGLIDAIPAVFPLVLGRDATPVEQRDAEQVVFHGGTFARVVLGLQRSTEGYDVVIAHFHQLAVGHGPDGLARYVWQYRLRQGVAPEREFSQLLTGNEVMKKYPPTDDDYYTTVGGPVKRFDFTR